MQMRKKTILGYLVASMIILCAWLSVDASANVQTMDSVADPYDTTIQQQIYEEIENKKEANTYTLENMLLIYNPYGTNTLSLYGYFETDAASTLSYTIHVEDEDIADFTRVISNEYTTEHEFQVIGLLPDRVNTIIFTIQNEEGVISEITTTYHVGSLLGEEAIQLEASEQSNIEEVTEGLYTLLGNDNDSNQNFIYLYDEHGVLRGEIPLGNFRSHRLVFQNDVMYFSYGTSQIAAMNSLGQIIATYDLENYELHHDYVLDDKGNLLILADDTRKTSKEDQIIALNLATGDVSLVVDFTQIMTLYYVTAQDQTSDMLDWLHLNTIQALGDGSIIVSSRETSTIIKLSNIYDQPSIDYMIGEETFWEDTAYDSLLLEKQGNFSSQGGQHSVTYVEDEGLEDGQYYLIMFNNNFGFSKSQSSYDWRLIPDIAVKTNDESANSYYYKYLVDELTGTYELVDSFAIPFSPYISSVQDINGNTVIDSGNDSILQEYNEDHELIRSFQVNSGNYVYRIYKYTFDGFYFNK